MADKRRGLGRGLGALIPSAPSGDARPVDVFFPGAPPRATPEVDPAAENGTAAETWRLSTQTVVQDAPASPSAWPVLDEPTNGTNGAASTNGTTTADHTDHATSNGNGPADGPATTEAADLVDGLLPVPGVRFAEVPLDSIRPNPRQPRTVFDEDALSELVGSIREVGVLQPVVVRPLSAADTHDGVAYELIMGERRWRATRAAGLDTIPAIIRETEDADLLRDALLENLHRSELNALEEAAAYQQLLDDFGCTHEELARRIHRSRPQISNTLRLLKLPPLVQRRVAAGVLSAGHARALLGLPDAAAMERLAQRIVAEGLSVRATEEVVTLGGDPERPAPRRRPRAGDRNGALDDLATRLSDRFETRVKIALGKSKGRLTVEFASVQDLNRILATLSPDDPGLLR
ncbi:MAG TPA: ParB/RepB/Spo0J family partition protein [Propionicimonas sp.]|jgi:ParB family chromosome partitioning protein